MISTDDFSKRRRFAWTVLLSSFGFFVFACVSIPLITVTYLRTTTQPLLTSVSANQGTVALAHDNDTTIALLVADPPQDVVAGAEIITNAADSALLVAYTPDTNRLALRGQLYGNTRIEVAQSAAPRFEFGNLPNLMVLNQSNGRSRFAVSEDFTLQINTPHGRVEIDTAGEYTIDVNNDEVQVAVQSGVTKVSTDLDDRETASLLLSSDQRAILRQNIKPDGPLDTERNLIKNGRFAADFSSWTVQDWTVELTDQPLGETTTLAESGESRLKLARIGAGHADAGLRQVINQNVADFESLRLLLSFRISQQTLGVCGTVGSECPLSVRIEYKDDAGASRTWEQGFYAIGAIAADTPDICVNCSPPYNPHQPAALGRLQSVDIDLLSSLSMQGANPPQQITSVSIFAAGHTFETEVLEIALLGEE